MMEVTGFIPKRQRMTSYEAIAEFTRAFPYEGGGTHPEGRKDVLVFEDAGLIGYAVEIIEELQFPLYPVILDGKLLVSYVHPISEHF